MRTLIIGSSGKIGKIIIKKKDIFTYYKHKIKGGIKLNLLKDDETERLYLLLAMIYEALEQNNTARKYYQTLITQYPESDYAISAYIKSRILAQY